MTIATDVGRIRELAVRILTDLQGAQVQDTPADFPALLYATAHAMLKVVTALEEVERRLNRLDAERSYLRRHGEQ